MGHADDVAQAAADGGEALPFNHHLGVRVRASVPGRAEVVLPMADHLRNHIGTMHAVAIPAPAELAAAIASTSRLADVVAKGYVPVVRRLSTVYDAPVRGDLVAVAEVDEAALEDARAALEAGERIALEVEVTLTCDGARVGTTVADVRLVPSDRLAASTGPA